MSCPEETPQRFSLVATGTSALALEDTGFNERALVAALASLLNDDGMNSHAIQGLERRSAIYADWIEEDRSALMCRFSAGAAHNIHIRMCRSLFEDMFSRFYGGSGQAESDYRSPSEAQIRFAARIAAGLGTVLPKAWSNRAVADLVLDGCDFEAAGSTNQTKLASIIVIDALMAGGPISFALPAEMLPTLRGSQSGQAPIPQPVNALHDRLVTRASNVGLPVRSVVPLATIPAARLLTLAIGDMLPFQMPQSLPLSVGGKYFAQGSLGEAHGAVAIRIDRIERG